VLSFIVPARNNPQFTAACLQSLHYSVSRLKLSDCEFILIDDESPPEQRMLDVFRQHRSNAPGHETKILRSRKNQHYSGVFSLGLHLATRDIVFFISNDMLVTPSFLEATLLTSALSPDFGIVRGTSNYTDSHLEHRVKPKNPLSEYEDIETFSRAIFDENRALYVEDKVLSGDAVLLKRALIDRIGVLDLRFFGYFGDIDYGVRAHLAGFKLVCAKGAWLFHLGGGHVKFDATSEAALREAKERRDALVQAAYQEFRDKWGLPASEIFVAGGSSRRLHFFDRVNPDGVPLKYDLPQSALADIETH
jgi:GT2 family glycosyltransferase